MKVGSRAEPCGNQAAWLIDQLGNPPDLRIVYDFSHYAFRDLSIEDTIQQARRLVGYVAMKDAIQSGDKVSFALPGESGSQDHRAIRKSLLAAGYSGDYCCEVSSQVSQQTGYDPIAAAKICHRNLAPLFGE